MNTYELWIKLNTQGFQTTKVRIQASNGIEAKMLGESMYGAGNVLNYTQVND
jgi:hypothetical protein